MQASFDLTKATGTDLLNILSDDTYRYKLFIKSQPYNECHAYWPLECTYIFANSKLFNALTKEGNMKHLYLDYYNNIKSDSEKDIYNAPQVILAYDIESIILYRVAKSYSES